MTTDTTGAQLADTLRWSRDLSVSVTTLTALPLRPSAGPVRRSAVLGYAPAVGIGLAAACAGVAQAGRWLFPHNAAVSAVLTIAVLALLTRGLHLDGLADTVDGFGAFRDRDRALAIMKQSDIGAFGVVALVLVLLTDVAVTAWNIEANRVWCVAVAIAASRLSMTLCGLRAIPPARAEGLGATVAGSVSLPVAAGWKLLLLLVAALPWAFGHSSPAIRGLAAVAVAAVAGQLLCRLAVRRFGGITGDVLGAVAEVSLAAGLVTTVIR
ncbi:MAG TPA: adenosylcobinamide-GDP ribazoletransferase [Mycobacteriales bacterium]|nr:adenosylcobinamide-GDP ribazoletransferase [Mycobacteriales bacterium]